MITLAFLLLGLQAPSVPPPAPAQATHESVVTTQNLAFVAKRIVGVWEQPPKADASTGITLSLASDGTATLSTGIVEDLNYNFDGKQLIVVDADDPEDVKQVSTVVLNGDSMKETNSESHESAEFVRVTPGEKNASLPEAKSAGAKIVGEWKRDLRSLPAMADMTESEKAKRMEIAQKGRYYYEPDGRLYVRIPLSQQSGRWDLASDGTLRLEFGGKAQESKISFDEEGNLVLTRADGREVYRKAEW
ncbi:MAG: hypothetical protein ABI383_08685 [Acidobacteriaceae bacterium]